VRDLADHFVLSRVQRVVMRLRFTLPMFLRRDVVELTEAVVLFGCRAV
jgi:hypothetical protein